MLTLTNIIHMHDTHNYLNVNQYLYCKSIFTQAEQQIIMISE